MTESIKNQVKVHSRLTVVSSTPTERVGHVCALSPLDHIMSSHTVHIIYYYRTSPFSKQGRYAMDLDNVRVSLSELLSKYPRMTGRLVRDVHGQWEVKYNDAGIRMLKADVGITVDQWLRFADESDERNLTVWEDMPDGDPTSWSPFQIQVNEFVGGGLAIGISFPHLLADPTSAILFYKSWTDSERGDIAGHHPPIVSLPQLDNHPPLLATGNPPGTIKYLQKNSKLTPTPCPTKMATASFKFSTTMIKQGLLKISNKCPDATPFEYLTALFWSQIIKHKTQMADSPMHSISLCVDARKLVDVPIPMKFFGNLLHFSQLCLQNEVLTGDNGIAEAVKCLHGHLIGIKKDDIFSMVDLLKSSREEPDGVYPNPVQMYGPELTCVNLDHLMSSKDELESLVYEAKFRNNEKPVHMSCHVGKADGAGLIIVASSPEGGLARTVTVTLPVVEVEKLCEDPVIMGMAPTMIVSGRRN
ncbi:hypothetical protein E3N88_43063 [Mikania micrantha]|uniref:Uncharacterized protein n=1 Tax=Mikania micrantha TaxID=192012 RepID=A0A5N6LFZ2_9ASTR|nr:hypothetical protein E3N88_43063 [Mikania micrantha]